MFNCKICKSQYKNFSRLQNHITKFHKDINLEQYFVENLVEDTFDFLCPICSNRKKFIGFTKGYSLTCGTLVCGHTYGMLKKYGVTSCSKLKEVKEKKKQTTLKNYGVENPSQATIVKEKKKQTTLKNYGVENPFQSEEIKKKIRKFCLEHVEEIRKKQKETCFKKYGVGSTLQVEEIRKKQKETCLKRYGVENPLQSKQIQDKVKETCLKRYGVENPRQSKQIQDKGKETSLKRYGVEHPLQSKDVQNRKWFKYWASRVPELERFFRSKDLEVVMGLDIETGLQRPLVLKCLKCGSIFNSSYWNVYQGCGVCRKCTPRISGWSVGELGVGDVIKSLGLEVRSNDRTIIKPLELDIVIESKKLAVEYCGLYWHSNKCNVGSKYHLYKLEQCIKAGYKLITIFEDEWILKQDIVKARLKHILGVDKDVIKLRASGCEIKEIDAKVKNEFLTQYHIQGKDNSSVKLGSYYNTELVAVMTFSKGSLAKGVKRQIQGTWELNRFCSNSSYHVYGVASKLLQYFKTNYNWYEIYSYADRRWSDGNLYKQLGFELDRVTAPNYWYWGNNIVGKAHRFNYRKSNLKHMSNYDPSLTEFQIMALEGYSWVYDCGNLKFKLDIKMLNL